MTIEETGVHLPQVREILDAPVADPDLGPFKLLPGEWESGPTGWNMIALPFVQEGSRLDYRLLLNQFTETLNFTLVDKKVPNRGLDETGDKQADQQVATLDYEQVVTQIAVVDRPESSPEVRGPIPAPIHHEPGLFLNMLNQVAPGEPTIARLATIPHGDAALVLGTHFTAEGPPRIPGINGLPIGVSHDVDNNPYLEPYKFFRDNPFKGTVDFPGFPGFDPVAPHALLDLANQGKTILRTTVLTLDTSLEPAGIRNIPFVVKQANATTMRSIFWINELDGTDENGDPLLELQYSQVVELEFFPRRDGLPGRISWPHVSINTLRKKSSKPAESWEMADRAARG